MSIQKPVKDTCDDCYKFFLANRKKKPSSNVSPYATGGNLGDSDDEGDDILDQEQREEQIEKAARHVKVAKAQRELANQKVAEAKEDSEKNVAHVLRRFASIQLF